MRKGLTFTTILIVLWVCILGGPAVAEGNRTYTVQPGDTMITVAANHNLTATELASANKLAWDDELRTGQTLLVPDATTLATRQQDGTYTVRPGDTLIGIAARHGVSVSQLASVNGLHINSWVYVGQQLRIPSTSSGVSATATTTSSTYIVRPGDTLIAIAVRNGVTLTRLAQANGLSTQSWVYVGQRLSIPSSSTSSTSTTTTSTGSTYTVRPGDTLIGIAARHGVSVSQLAATNGLQVNSWVYVGQRLRIPGSTSSGTSSGTTTTPAPTTTTGEKWIDVNLSAQTLTAYSGQTPVFTTRVSTGTWQHPTVVGTFSIYVKYTSAPMSGPGYYLPGVPYVMYFYRGYGIHGTYWHNNFGTPMSHGCVNMRTSDARWLFNWAPVGTKVVTHY